MALYEHCIMMYVTWHMLCELLGKNVIFYSHMTGPYCKMWQYLSQCWHLFFRNPNYLLVVGYLVLVWSLQQHNNRPWVWHFPICYCNPWSVLMDYVALSLNIRKLGGRPGLVAYGNATKGLGVSQLLKAYDVAKGPSSIAIGTWHLWTPTLPPSKDWCLSPTAMCWEL